MGQLADHFFRHFLARCLVFGILLVAERRLSRIEYRYQVIGFLVADDFHQVICKSENGARVLTF